MKFFIDTANLEEIREAKELGMIDGVTTNPSLVAKEGCKNRDDFKKLVYEICELVQGPVSAEVVSTDVDGMVKEARELAEIHQHVVVKIPMITDGLKATLQLTEAGIKINVTLVFSPLQALLAAKAGATYVSPFVGRLDDISHTGMELVAQILEIYQNYIFETEVLVASIRNPLHVLEAAQMGADVATIPFKVISQLAKHPLTDIGMKQFLDDWKKVDSM
ncbi:MAG: fructose-6-phosphate aldolase [Deltaproteobacteria bacterium]|jgi:transaldolase|nr:fructose-6-phosphate aldolase [Deltaproteobacteria bacterium]